MDGLDGGRRGDGGERAERLPAVLDQHAGRGVGGGGTQCTHASGALYTWTQAGGWAGFPSLPQGGHSIWPVAARAGIVQ